MNLFDRVKKEETGTLPDGVSEVFVDTLSEALGKTRLNQDAFFGTVVGKGEWEADFLRGEISFSGMRLPIQFIGSESRADGTWRWSVQNASGFPARILEDAILFTSSRTIERFHEISGETLAMNSFVNGHTISTLICSLHYEPVCYYRCPYPGGAAYVLIKNLPGEVFTVRSPEAGVMCLKDFARQKLLNHKLLARAVLADLCEGIRAGAQDMSGRLRGGGLLSVSFDSRDKIISAQLSGE